eukprot:Nk52_evm4s553 gene=Nk52_evmTU4s553
MKVIRGVRQALFCILKGANPCTCNNSRPVKTTSYIRLGKLLQWCWRVLVFLVLVTAIVVVTDPFSRDILFQGLKPPLVMGEKIAMGRIDGRRQLETPHCSFSDNKAPRRRESDLEIAPGATRWREFGTSNFIEFLNLLFEKYGIISFARSGTALGALRHHGRIPYDTDMDIFWIIPRNVSVGSVYKTVEREALGFPGISFHYVSLASLFIYDRSDIVVLRQLNSTFTRIFDIDVEVISEELFFSDEGYKQHIFDKYGMDLSSYVQDMCKCDFEDAYLHCFEEKSMRTYLSLYYGEDFMIPLRGIESLDMYIPFRKWFWRTTLGDWMIESLRELVFSVYQHNILSTST